MLYQDKTLGRASLGRRLALRFQAAWRRTRYADLDLLSLSPHLQRDLGIVPPGRPMHLEIWRK